MNYSTAVFLVNNLARAIQVSYESAEKSPKTIFKTLDASIKVGDFVVVPTHTRHEMTVVKVAEVDVDFDIDSPVQMDWIIEPVDRSEYERILRDEEKMVSVLKHQEIQKKREAIRDTLFKDHLEKLKTLEISNIGDSPEPSSSDRSPTA